MDNLVDIVLLYVVLLISLVVHEAAHALFALLGGDKTAYVGGQVTLNPVPHIRREPVGTVVLPLIALFVSGGTMCFGYATTPIDPLWAHRHPRRAALMSAAGPVSNFLLAALALLVLKSLVWAGVADEFPGAAGSLLFVSPHEPEGATFAIARIASVFLLLNVLLGVFNLLPWPPLDGAGVVEGLIPDPMQRLYAYVRSNTMVMILGIVAIWQILPSLWIPVLRVALDFL